MILASSAGVTAQRIVVDSASTNKYLIKPTEKKRLETKEDVAFSDRALSIGKGIINRLKARLNLEEAAESIKNKKEKILGNPKEENTEKRGG